MLTTYLLEKAENNVAYYFKKQVLVANLQVANLCAVALTEWGISDTC